MKRIIYWICIMALTFGSLGGCGKDGNVDNGHNTEIVETKVQDSTENTVETVLEKETETVVEAADTSNIPGGLDMGSATEISLNKRIYGQTEQGQSAWYSFTTPMNLAGGCEIGVVNKTAEPGLDLYAVVYDSEENMILGSGHIESSHKGEISMGQLGGLKANTSYYIELYEYHTHASIDYMLMVSDGSLRDMMQEEIDADSVESEDKNTNFDAAKKILNSGKLVKGTVTGKEAAWFWFKTDEAKQAEYTISFTHRTNEFNGSAINYSIIGAVYEADGRPLMQEEAQADGLTKSISLSDLEPGRVYWCCLYSYQSGDSLSIDYAIRVTGGSEREEITGFEEEMEKYDAYATGDGTNQAEPICIANNSRIDGSVIEGRCSYLEFETPMEIKGECKVLVVNKSVVHNWELYFDVLDDTGASVIGGAQHSGVYGYRGYPMVVTIKDAKPHKKYYMQIRENNHNAIDYMVKVMIPTVSEKDNTDIAENSAEVLGAASDPEPGDNTSIAQPIMLETNGTAYDGSIRVNDSKTAGAAWFWFKTGNNAKAKYKISIKNHTKNETELIGEIVDEFGNSIINHELKADKGNTTDSVTVSGLEKDTVYYCQLYAYNAYEIDYTISINSKNAKEKEKKNEKLVLSKPIELTNNQVMFKGGSDEYVNKEDVIRILTPIAKIMKDHPEHGFLLVGSTATAETEEYCLDLSTRRADAVKNVLVNELEVPEKQLQTIGNGFHKKPFTRAKDRDDDDRFIESEGAKNRRVIVVDIEHEAAKMLLKD